MHGPRNWLLATLFLLLTAATLALTACNSGSGGSQRAAGSGNSVTGAQTPSSAKPAGKGTLADALTNRVGQP